VDWRVHKQLQLQPTQEDMVNNLQSTGIPA